MRLWSIHPSYLDIKGLLALWRESLLALAVLEGRTVGYRKHPQLLRFKDKPLSLLHAYLTVIYDESLHRGYHFNRNKFIPTCIKGIMPVSVGQLKYERLHLLNKLRKRDYCRYMKYSNTFMFPHPLFTITDSEAIEPWEILPSPPN